MSANCRPLLSSGLTYRHRPQKWVCSSVNRIQSRSFFDSVRHGTLGDGVVVRVESDGVVTVRFADDGSERRLMLDYAPLEKIA